MPLQIFYIDKNKTGKVVSFVVERDLCSNSGFLLGGYHIAQPAATGLDITVLALDVITGSTSVAGYFYKCRYRVHRYVPSIADIERSDHAGAKVKRGIGPNPNQRIVAVSHAEVKSRSHVGPLLVDRYNSLTLTSTSPHLNSAAHMQVIFPGYTPFS